MKKTNKNRILLLLLFWLALIFVTSSFVVPFDTFVEFVQRLNGNDAFKQGFAHFWLVSWFFIVKGWHATEYAILVILGTHVLQRGTKCNRRKCIGAAFAFAVIFAASDEWHQTFVQGRDGCVRDVLIDTIGASLSAGGLWFQIARKTRQIKTIPSR